MRTSLARFVLVLAAAHAASPALAQCDKWIYAPSAHAPVQTILDCAATYTPSGISVPRLVVGGVMFFNQGTDYHRIAQFDGTNWSPLGSGFSSRVEALTSWTAPSGPQLIAAGSFAYTGDLTQVIYGVAAWNGSSWSALQQNSLGLLRNNEPAEGSALTTYQSQLVVGGDFAYAGFTAASNIARWNGSAWSPLGSGMDQPVRALTTWDPDGSGPQAAQLVAAGEFLTAGGLTCNGIARWDGSWHPLGTGLENPGGFTPQVRGLVSWDPDGSGPLNPVIVVAGNFTNATGVPALGIAYWDGSWHGMGTNPGTIIDGLTVWTPTGSTTPYLVASGIFYDQSANSPELSPRYWNGATWVPLTPTNTIDADALCSYDPDGAGSQAAQLVVAGDYSFLTPNGDAVGLARLIGSDWQSFGAAPVTYAGAVYANQLVMGGSFQSLTDIAGSYAHTPDAFNLVQWNGVSHTSFGGTNSGATGNIRALKSFTQPGATHNPELVVGGSFGVIAGMPANNIARYVSSSVVGQSGWFTMGGGLDSSVYAIERLNNVTYAAGTFITSSTTYDGPPPITITTTVNHIARWDGTAWQPLISNNQSGLNGFVYALKTYNGALYAGGTFTTAGGLASGGLARWDGTSWSRVVGGFAGNVYSLEVFNNELIIGGDYPGLADAHNIAKYNSTTNSYSNLATGGTNGPVRALCIGPDSNLYVGGEFTTAGGVSANHIARWNSSAWSDVRGGVNGPVYALTTYRNEVNALGNFGKAGSSNVASPSWARFTIDGIPWIADQPDNISGVCVGHSALFHTYEAVGYSPVTYTWLHNGSPMTNGVTPWGSTIYGGTWSLRIDNVHPQDKGSYSAIVSTSCGSVATTAATLGVNSADFNGDGDVGTDADISDFFSCVSGFCCPTCGTADFNGDGDVGTDADIEAFFRVLAGGPC